MYKRWLAVLTSLGLLLGAVALVWQADQAGAAAPPRQMFFPLIMRGAFATGTPSSLAVSVSGQIGANGNITYRVTITNRGDKTVTVLPLDFGYNTGSLAFLSAQYTPDQRGPGGLRWNNLTEFPGIGPLAPNATRTLDIVMDPVVCPEGGVITVQALISGALDASNQIIPPASTTVGQKLCTSLTVVKSVVEPTSGQALVGDPLTFDIVVTNPPENAAAPPNLQNVRGIQLTDRFNPDIMAYRRALLDVGNGFIPISPTTPITTTPIGSLTFSDALANITLRPGDSMRVRITFEVRACSSEAGTANVAEVGSPGAGGALVTQARGQSPTIRIICPNIQVTKKILAPPGGVVALNEGITFTIAVKATGNQPINVIPMQDVFDPTALAFVSSDPQPSGRPIAGTVEWDDLNKYRGSSLQPGETYTVTAVFRAVGCPVGGRTANRARIGNAIASGGGYGFNAPQASDTIEFDIACPRVDVTKRVVTPRSALIQELGGQVTYEVMVRNSGNLPLVTVPLTDTYDSALFDFVSASVAPSSQSGGSLAWANLAAGAPLQPGESVVVLLTLKTKICPDPTKPITSVNRAGVSGARASFRTTLLDVPPDFDQAEVDVVCAQLRISKTLVSPSNGAVSPGVVGRNEMTFKIEISNTGNITVTRLPLLDEWDPAFLEFVRSDITPDVPGQGTLSWENLTAPDRGGPLLPGRKITFNIIMRAIGCPADQIVFNKASIVGALAIAGGAGVPAPVPNVYASDDGRVACPKLEITKRLVAAPDCDIVGINQNIGFDVTIRNVGNSTIATLPLTDTYEAEYLAFVSATPAPNGPPTFTGSGQFRSGTVAWADVTGPAPNGLGRDLPPGESLTVRVTFKTLKSTYDIVRSPNKNTLNRAGITGAKDEYGFTAPTVSTPPVPVRIAQADLHIEKVQETQFAEVNVNASTQLTATLPIGYPILPLTSQMSNKVAVPGEVITYTVNYRNTGPDEATFVRITDVIPPGTEYLGHTLASCHGRDIREGCYIGEIAPGQTGQFKVMVRLPRVTESGFSTPPGTTLTNTIRIESGFSIAGPTCGIPDYFDTDNTSSWASDVISDFGDAPATAQDGLPGFGAQVTAAYSGNGLHEWLGRSVSAERGANDAKDPDGAPNLNPYNYDFHDDGALYRNPFNAGVPSSQRYYQPGEFAAGTKVIMSVSDASGSRYANSADKRIYVESWADANRDGKFGDDGDKLMFRWNGGPGLIGSDGKLWPLGQPFYILEATDLNIQAPASLGWMFVRTRLSYGAQPSMSGPMDYGEIEDNLIGVFQGAPPESGNPPGPVQPPTRP